MTAIQLPDGAYRIVAPRFVCAVRISNGRVDRKETAPILRRLGGMLADAFARYVRGKGWKVEAVRERKAPE